MGGISGGGREPWASDGGSPLTCGSGVFANGDNH